jgi:hypothetical protein
VSVLDVVPPALLFAPMVEEEDDVSVEPMLLELLELLGVVVPAADVSAEPALGAVPEVWAMATPPARAAATARVVKVLRVAFMDCTPGLRACEAHSGWKKKAGGCQLFFSLSRAREPEVGRWRQRL